MGISSDWIGAVNTGTGCNSDASFCTTSGPYWDDQAPFSRAEFNFGPTSVTYDISLIYGYNAGMEISSADIGCDAFACTIGSGCPVPGPGGSCYSPCCSSIAACGGGALPAGGGGCVNNAGPGPNSPFYYDTCYNAYAFPDNDGAAYLRRVAQRPRGSDGAWLHDRAPLSSAKGNHAIATVAVSTNALNTKLVVSNLHYEITPKDLVSIFGQIGTLVREPLIRYDRSGRSSGVAIITYEKPAEATRAKKEFEGKLAKGQSMEIAFDTAPPRRVRSASMPGVSTASLLNRIERPSLTERLGSGEDSKQPTTGPIRARAPRSSRGGVGPRSRGGRPTRPKAKTAEELDRELDVFMADDGKDVPVDPESKVMEPVAAPQDVEMA
ncbi:hypothetical protein J3R83DRAFT_5081 [Lanmaoa asiatica]|nr:hypothetical protein J3R83DRAFT_5081 [Lanmaoa asiatica]